MPRVDSIKRYHIIINALRRSPKTLAEIQDILRDRSEDDYTDYTTSPRTFARDKNDILSIYRIGIQYDFSSKKYFIETNDLTDDNVRLIEAYDIYNALSLKENYSNFINFEKRKIFGTEYLEQILKAIKKRKKITFTYNRFEKEGDFERTVAPLALKEFKHRWYMLAKGTDDGSIKTYSLDRIVKITTLNESFEFPMDFNIEHHYKYSFGIITPNEAIPEKIIISTNKTQSKYIKSLPIHSSQKVIKETDDEVQFEYNLFLTHDLFMEILSYGDKIKVLSPQSLIEDLKDTAQKLLKICE